MIGDRTILEAGAEALLMGFQYCINNQLLPLILETDSLTLTKILDGIGEVPWSISLRILKIRKLMAVGRGETYAKGREFLGGLFC